jgi:TolB-like protein/DNA-binding winged helix-turn-helix (wHTH) protein
MPAPVPAGRTLRFAAFEVDLAAGELRKHGIRIKLQEQPFQILVLLLDHPGEVITREQLQQQLWPGDTFVDFDNSLNAAISKLRQALGDTAGSPRFVETLARRGYRFLAPVEGPTSDSPPAAPPPEPSTIFVRQRRLPRLWVGAAALLVLLAALAAWLFGLNPAGWKDRLLGRSSIRSLAVLPFENLSRDAEQEFFADGMHDALITSLAKIGSLRVISRSSVMQYKRAPKAMPKIGRELQVDALVEGTVLRSGDRVRITAQLIEAATDKHLWAESYEGDLRDVLRLQDDVARAIANEIKVTLSPQEQARLSGSRRVDPDAYQAYLRGRYYSDKRTPEDLSKGIEYLPAGDRKGPGLCTPLLRVGGRLCTAGSPRLPGAQ